jgi:hypothetical protein
MILKKIGNGGCGAAASAGLLLQYRFQDHLALESEFVSGSSCIGQFSVASNITSGGKVYIEKMEGFETYLTAAFAKKKVQLIVTSDASQADYVISGVSAEKKAGWAKIVFMGNIHSDAAASITMTDKKNVLAAMRGSSGSSPVSCI